MTVVTEPTVFRVTRLPQGVGTGTIVMESFELEEALTKIRRIYSVDQRPIFLVSWKGPELTPVNAQVGGYVILSLFGNVARDIEYRNIGYCEYVKRKAGPAHDEHELIIAFYLDINQNSS